MGPDVDHKILPKVLEVTEISEVKLLNDYLKAGWKIINVHNRAYEDSGFRDQFSVYCLGWVDDSKKPVHPLNGLHVEYD